MTERTYHEALLTEAGPGTRSVRRRRVMMPVVTGLARIAPNLKVPIASYLPWTDLIDDREGRREAERATSCSTAIFTIPTSTGGTRCQPSRR